MKKTYITPCIKCRSLLSEGLIANSFQLVDDEIGDDNESGFSYSPKKDNYWGGADWEEKGDKN